MSASLESILESINQLPRSEQRQLVETLTTKIELTEEEKARNQAMIEKWYGAFKGLDRETVIALAEDDEFCGY